jgi:transcriptional regulator with XRE-family HTH domain
VKSARSRPGHFKIGAVARLVGVSPFVLRSWESLGLVRPSRTPSRYRLYTPREVRLLKRAKFLRQVRGMNAPAILHVLKSRGLVRVTPGSEGGPNPTGPHLRALRLKRGLSLSAVATATGVSVGFLSALERSQMSASVGTLRKLASLYGVEVLDFFNPTVPGLALVRPRERKLLAAGPGVRMELLAWGNTVMEPHLFRILPGAGSGEAYAHDGEEFLFILKGRLAISLDSAKPRLLNPGDSFYFQSRTPHSWVNPGKRETQVLWINSPPTF